MRRAVLEDLGHSRLNRIHPNGTSGLGNWQRTHPQAYDCSSSSSFVPGDKKVCPLKIVLHCINGLVGVVLELEANWSFSAAKYALYKQSISSMVETIPEAPSVKTPSPTDPSGICTWVLSHRAP